MGNKTAKIHLHPEPHMEGDQPSEPGAPGKAAKSRTRAADYVSLQEKLARAPIDRAKVKYLAMAGLSLAEIAAVIGCSQKRLEKYSGLIQWADAIGRGDLRIKAWEKGVWQKRPNQRIFWALLEHVYAEEEDEARRTGMAVNRDDDLRGLSVEELRARLEKVKRELQEVEELERRSGQSRS